VTGCLAVVGAARAQSSWPPGGGREVPGSRPRDPAAAPAPTERPALEPGGIVVSLRQAVEIAVADNLGIDNASFERRISHVRAESPRGAFDPVLSVFYDHRRDVQPTATELDAATSQTTADSMSATLAQKLWYGASWEVGLTSSRRESNNPFVTLSPSYSADVTLAYTQPLLQGLGRDANLRELRKALNDATVSDHAFRTTVSDTMRDTVYAYWDLVFAREDLAVRRASLELAQRLLEQNRIMVEVGTLAPLDLAESRAAVAEREQDIIVGQAQVGNAEDALRRLLGVKEDSPWWLVPLVPADEPTFRDAYVDLSESLELALERRWEIESARLRAANGQLDVAAARDGLRPQLDFELSVSTAGLSGDLRDFQDSDGDTVPDLEIKVSDDDLGGAYDQVTNRDFNSWSARLVYRQPIFDRAGKSAFLASRLAFEASLLDIEVVRQSVILDVRQAVRDVESAREALVATRANVELQEEKLDAEGKKFENGMSTNFRVLEFQTDLTTALTNDLRARVAYLKALATLQRAQGTIADLVTASLVDAQR
jgi:outer membrane protein TolC